MTTTTTTTTTCTCCNAPAPAGTTCDPCQARRIRSLLRSKGWREVRGTTSGDRPGETLEQSMRRELAALEAAELDRLLADVPSTAGYTFATAAEYTA